MSLECPVCLDLPEGEVHQCNEGHCYCAACWNRLEEPRRCPECRQPIPQANRNRTAERAIAALEWSCEHCGEATTRGAKAAHVSACPQRPTVCAASAAGCGWAGMMSEQAAHDSACPFAICLRMMAPLQAQNQQLQARCDGFQSECQELRGQVAALQPLAGRVRALEGVETEEGGRRQRQRMGPAPHDAPPSDAALAVMGLAEVVAALRAHVAVERVVEKAGKRLVVLSIPVGSEQAAAEVGVIEAVLDGMRAHPHVALVQQYGGTALCNVCCGNDDAARDRKRRTSQAGGRSATVTAMQAHPADQAVQQIGLQLLGWLPRE